MSLRIYEFCSSNGLYSASLSFGIFIFLLTHFGTWDLEAAVRKCSSKETFLKVLQYSQEKFQGWNTYFYRTPPAAASGDYYFIPNLTLVLLTIVLLIKKHVTLFCSLLKMKKLLCHISLFLCLSGISLGRYCWKSVIKSRGFGKGRDGHVGGCL